MFRIFSQCSESVQTFSEFLVQKLVYSEFLDFVVMLSTVPDLSPLYLYLEYGASISCGNILPFLHLHKTLTNIHHSRIYKYIIIVVHVPVIYSIAMTMLISVDNT